MQQQCGRRRKLPEITVPFQQDRVSLEVAVDLGTCGAHPLVRRRILPEVALELEALAGTEMRATRRSRQPNQPTSRRQLIDVPPTDSAKDAEHEHILESLEEGRRNKHPEQCRGLAVRKRRARNRELAYSGVVAEHRCSAEVVGRPVVPLEVPANDHARTLNLQAVRPTSGSHAPGILTRSALDMLPGPSASSSHERCRGAGPRACAAHPAPRLGTLRRRVRLADQLSPDRAREEPLLSIREERLRPSGEPTVDDRQRARRAVERDPEREPAVVAEPLEA